MLLARIVDDGELLNPVQAIDPPSDDALDAKIKAAIAGQVAGGDTLLWTAIASDGALINKRAYEVIGLSRLTLNLTETTNGATHLITDAGAGFDLVSPVQMICGGLQAGAGGKIRSMGAGGFTAIARRTATLWRVDIIHGYAEVI